MPHQDKQRRAVSKIKEIRSAAKQFGENSSQVKTLRTRGRLDSQISHLASGTAARPKPPAAKARATTLKTGGASPSRNLDENRQLGVLRAQEAAEAKRLAAKKKGR
ncbi:MAG: hypothetical protein E4G90_01015 [Gemmatimonadales bacterium]|nr:MAG: hypothetical protein E4G90_01015 [Gemmatimonadales bacterium]